MVLVSTLKFNSNTIPSDIDMAVCQNESEPISSIMGINDVEVIVVNGVFPVGIFTSSDSSVFQVEGNGTSAFAEFRRDLVSVQPGFIKQLGFMNYILKTDKLVDSHKYSLTQKVYRKVRGSRSGDA
jgi:hypothetical protein